MDKKKNTFRDEVEESKVSPAEEMNRNQAVYLLYLQGRKVMMTADNSHLLGQIDMFKEMAKDIEIMPDCECKEAQLASINQQIEQHEKAMAGCEFGGINVISLDALERLANLTLQVEGGKGVSKN